MTQIKGTDTVTANHKGEPKQTIKYGAPPHDLGHVDVPGDEMMMYVYLPIVTPDHLFDLSCALPERLWQLDNLLEKVFDDLDNVDPDADLDHVYITMKRMWVDAASPGNRPGWHADGYGSGGDINYIWSDMNPTEFAVQEFSDIPDDDIASMEAMERQIDPSKIVTYPDRHLLRLDESVVHRVSPSPQAGVRTFVKISVSSHRYNLRGNSHNYLLDYDWPMHDRFGMRNVDNKDFRK